MYLFRRCIIRNGYQGSTHHSSFGIPYHSHSSQEVTIASVLAPVTIPPQHVDEFITLHRELAGEYLREEAGTLGFDVIQDEKMANHFYFHETYVDESAFHAHMHGEI